MIFFYQIRSYIHKIEVCTELSCPLCGNKGGMEIGLYQKYAWMLLPIAPSVKYGIAGCNSCGQTLPNTKWTDEIESRYQELKKTAKTPGKLWRGLFLLPLYCAVFIGAIIIAVNLLGNYSKTNHEKRAATFNSYISHPQKGDYYRVRVAPNGMSEWRCTYMRFLRVSGDTIFMEQLRQSLPGLDSWDELGLNRPNTFDTVPLPMDFQNLKKNQLIGPIGQRNPKLFLYALERNGEVLIKY